MIHDKPLQAFHDYRGQGYRAVVIHGSRVWRLGQRYYGGAFETDGHPGLAEGDVEYVREDVLQLFCTFPQHTTWDVIWTSSLSRVDVREDPLHAVRGQLE